MVTKKKKSVFITAILLLLIVILTLLLLLITFDNTKTTEQNKSYVLKSHGDYLALYNGDTIIEVYDEIVISSLPTFDREQFLSGVKINNLEQLDEILEDFE